jgi:GTP pyrophosphokinase
MPETVANMRITTERFDQALLYASAHHRRQLRKGTAIPYVSHVLAVASIVLEMGGDEDEAIGALLHDVVEDGGGPAAAAEIRQRFGAAVADIVLANSDRTDDGPSKPPWRERKVAYIDGIATKSPAALRVSLADKLHNARAILQDLRTHGPELWSRFNAGDGPSVRWYYRALTEAFEARADALGPEAAPALRELRSTVDELDRLDG